MLTEQRKMFVEEYLKLRCKNATQAAKNAGYSHKTAHSQASMILKDPEVMAYLKMRKDQLESDLRQEFIYEASDAFKVMIKIMNDWTARDADRLAAAKDILDRAGYKPKNETRLSGSLETNNPMAGLTTEELRELIRRSD